MKQWSSDQQNGGKLGAKPLDSGIMVVDDDPASLQLLVDVMVKEGYHVRPSNSGELALRSASRRPPELILLDVQMPGMDGYEVCRNLKENPATQDIPVLFLSALRDTESKVLGLQAGAVDFISKPFQAEEVLARVRVHLLLSRTRAALDEMCLHLTEKVVDRGNDLAALSEALQAKVEEHQELATKLRLASKAIEAAGDAIVITDRQGIPLTVNPAFTAITGFATTEVLGCSALPLFPGSWLDDNWQAVMLALTERGSWFGEVRLQPKSGRSIPVWMNIAAVYDDGSVVTHYVCIFFDISRLKKAQARIEFLAHHDVLTGLPNRVLLQDRFDTLAALAQRDGHSVGLLYIDLDNFKTINDSLGHSLGDGYLLAVCQRIKRCIRHADLLCRLGGDEFIILVSLAKDGFQLGRLAGKIIDCIKAPVTVAGHELQRSASVGIALFPADGGDLETLVRKADTAMYRAKEQGRNQYVFFCDSMDAQLEHQFKLEGALRQALEQGRLLLRYQPQVDLDTRRIVGIEALVRWQHPEWGEINPKSFISLAEETGLIVPLGEWVIEETCRQAAEWAKQGIAVPVSVNVSATELRRGRVGQWIEECLSRYGLAAEGLVMEITETGLIDNTEETNDLLASLNRIGVGLAIDDFGTGYSSFAYLQRFAASQLKIDQSFVSRMTAVAQDQAIVNAIVKMAQILRIATVAEGVETESQRELLVGMGCATGQGYLFAKPLLAGPMTALLRRGFCA